MPRTYTCKQGKLKAATFCCETVMNDKSPWPLDLAFHTEMICCEEHRESEIVLG